MPSVVAEPLTGRGADLLLIDDPLKDQEEARSEVIRRALHEWYSAVAYTRLQPGGAIVLISTRWHEDDLAGRPATRVRGRRLGGAQPAGHRRELMKVFVAPVKRFGQSNFRLRLWNRFAERLAVATWASLYQQRPSAAEGTVFQKTMVAALPRAASILIASFSPGIRRYKTGSQNDFSV